MRRALRFTLLALVAAAAVGALAWAYAFTGGAGAGPAMSRREAFAGLLGLGVLALALYGFDLRDWF